MYKLTILFFFLTAFNSQGLMDSYKITFDNENASCILNINNGGLVFENNQPDVTVTPIGDDAADTDKSSSTSGKIYKITKGITWQDGLKIGGNDDIDMSKIGENDDVDMSKVVGANGLFSFENHHAYEIKLSFKFVMVVEKSSNVKQQFEIPDSGLFIYINGDKFSLFK